MTIGAQINVCFNRVAERTRDVFEDLDPPRRRSQHRIAVNPLAEGNTYVELRLVEATIWARMRRLPVTSTPASSTGTGAIGAAVTYRGRGLARMSTGRR